MKTTTGLSLGALMLVAWFMFTTSAAYATDWEECDHPRFLEHGCGYEGEDGADGADGADGQDGRDGIDGIDGIDGKDGRDGIDGKDGVVPTEWITNTNNTFNIHNKWIQSARDALAAQTAMQVFLPQDQTQRITFSGAKINNTTGVGVGYAYMFDNERNSALTLSVGRAGDETAVRGSFGFEFGGSRRIEMPTIAPEPEPIQPAPVPTGMIQIDEAEYSDLMAQAVQKEEFEEAVELGEYRHSQQQSLIEELKLEIAKHETDDEDIDRLKQEAAALRAAQEAEEKKQSDIRAQFKRRLDARYNKGEDKEPDE